MSGEWGVIQISNQATRRNPKQPCTAGMSGSPLTAMRVRDLSLRLVAIRPRYLFHAREAFPQNALMEKRKLHFMSLNLSYSFTSKFHKFQPVPQDRDSLDIHHMVKHPVPKSLFRGVVETKFVFFVTISEAFRSSSIYVYPFGTYGRRRVGASSTQKTCNLIMFSVL